MLHFKKEFVLSEKKKFLKLYFKFRYSTTCKKTTHPKHINKYFSGITYCILLKENESIGFTKPVIKVFSKNTLFSINKACVVVAALKNIHAIVTNIKHIEVRINVVISVCLGSLLFATRLISCSMMSNKPCIAPQIINVQFAPCQNPLTINTINRLKYQRGVDTLFPPNGI